MFNKYLSALLIAAMLLSGLSVPALAEEGASDSTVIVESVPAPTASEPEPSAEPKPETAAPLAAEMATAAQETEAPTAEAEPSPAAGEDNTADKEEAAEGAPETSAAPTQEQPTAEPTTRGTLEQSAEPGADAPSDTPDAGMPTPEPLTSGDFIYVPQEGTAKILGYIGNATEVTLPGALGDCPAVLVGAGAFANCASVARITAVETSISFQAGAFDGCAGDLVLVGLPGSAIAAFAAEAGLTFEPLAIAPTAVALRNLTIGVGQVEQLPVTLAPENATTTLTFASSSTRYVQVNAAGVVKGMAAGRSTITVRTANGKKATCRVTVVKAPSAIALNATSATLGAGDTFQLTYKLTRGTAARVAFASNKEDVARVDAETGRVEALQPGVATITAATHNGKRAYFTVTVVPAPTSIVLTPAEIVIGQAQTAAIAGAVNSGSAGRVTFASANSEIVAVNANGVITGMGVGETEIVAGTYVEGVEARARVTVLPGPETVSLGGAMKLGVGDRFQLTPVIPEGTMTAYAFASSNTKVARVTADGLVTARAVGRTNITVWTSNGKKATCRLTVVKAPSAIALNAKYGTLGKGDTFQLIYKISKGTLSTVTFASNNEAVAHVDPRTGLVEARENGVATITAATHNGRKAYCRVTVVNAPESILLTPAETVIGQAQTTVIAGAVNSGAAGHIAFASADPAVATVNANGMVTGVGVGETEIIATTYVEGVEARARVTVLPGPDRVSIGGPLKLGLKDHYQLTPVIPEGTMTAYAFSSSNSKVVKVTAGGLIAARAVGTATITVRTSNGKKATCRVTVVKAPSAIALNVKSGTLGVHSTYQLLYKITKNTAATVTFASSDERVVRVDPRTGLVEAVGEGKALIGAFTHNGKKAYCTVYVKPAPTSILLSADEFLLGQGQKATITGTVNSGAYGTVTFTSSDPRVASVNANGVISAVGVGTAEITASTYVEGVASSATVTVMAAPDWVTVPATVSIGAGDLWQLDPAIPDGSISAFAYASSNTRVATVSSSGTIMGKAKGTATITVKTYNGKTATCKVTVTAAPTKIVLSAATATLGLGETLQLQASLTGGTANSVFWSSSDPGVVSVDAATGLITAVSGGPAVITATTYNNLKATCAVEVINAPTEISISGAQTRDIGIGQSLKLEATLSEGSYSAVSWTSSSADVATVDNSGMVRATAVGRTVITASTYVDGVVDSIQVTVNPAPESISLRENTVELMSFTSYQIEPILAQGYSAEISYGSSNSAVASVDANGLVTGYEPGIATVTVTTHNGKTAQLSVRVYDPNQPEAIYLGDLPDYLTIGSTQQIEFILVPEAAGREMIWSSVDPDIATVSDTGLVTALSPGLAIINGVSRRNSALTIEYGFIVLSATRALTIPAAQTGVNGIEANMERIRAIEGSAYAEIYQERASGAISEAEYVRRIAIIKNSFSMYAFPWMTPTSESYWSEANSENGAKNFRTGVVYYGVPYTGNTSNRNYSAARLVSEGYYTKSEDADYYVWNTSKFSDRAYKGSDCSGFAGIAYFGSTSRGYSFSSSIFATDSAFKTVSWSQPMRTGDLLVAAGHHVAIFLYYVDAAKTQIMIIDQGGGYGSVNTVSTSIKKISYYTSRGYIIRRLNGFAN